MLARQKSIPSTIFNSAGVATVGARRERSPAALFRARCKTSNFCDFEAVVSLAHTAFSLTTSSTYVRSRMWGKFVPHLLRLTQVEEVVRLNAVWAELTTASKSQQLLVLQQP